MTKLANLLLFIAIVLGTAVSASAQDSTRVNSSKSQSVRRVILLLIVCDVNGEAEEQALICAQLTAMQDVQGASQPLHQSARSESAPALRSAGTEIQSGNNLRQRVVKRR